MYRGAVVERCRYAEMERWCLGGEVQMCRGAEAERWCRGAECRGVQVIQR
jgi:hypothetical protein